MPSSTRTTRSAAREVSQQTPVGTPGAVVAPSTSAITSDPRTAESYLTFGNEERKQVGVPVNQETPMLSHTLA